MPNLNSGPYDGATKGRAPREPGPLRKVLDTVIVYLTVTALLVALSLFVFWTTSKSAADDYRDGYPDRRDRPQNL